MRHSMACPCGVSSRSGVEREPLAPGDPYLPADQIDTGHHLGDRVLDLQSRVHLEEVEPTTLVEQELDRAGVGVPDRACDRRRGRGDCLAELCRHGERWCFLDDLLVTALNRAFTLDKRQHGSEVIPEQLHLDVSRVRDASLEIDGRVTERGAGLGTGRADRRRAGRTRPSPFACPCRRLRRPL